MNWDRLQTYGLSPEKSFEMICNQLFENWCKEEFISSLFSFTVVNGAGGDGGVESYAVLTDGSIIGLQAKWFRTSISSNQIDQIRKSLRTAKKVRSEITKYIVCVPRDLSSSTARGKDTESKRWDSFIREMKTEFPDLELVLWNDTRITTELQKPLSAGIHRFWFSNSELEHEKFSYSFNKAKTSWLSTKYVPDLNTAGQISTTLSGYIGQFDLKAKLAKEFRHIIDLCKQFESAANNLVSACGGKSANLDKLLLDAKGKLHALQGQSEKLEAWLNNEFIATPLFDERVFFVPYESLAASIKKIDISYSYHFHIFDVTRVLEKLASIDFYRLIDKIKAHLSKQCILFLGNPGTGKTQGVSAFAEGLLNQQYHIPIIVQARSIPESYDWRDIVIHTLGLSDAWNEDELWQALLSVANRNRFQEQFLEESISIIPKVLIIVDGIDESASHEKWINRVKECGLITELYPQIRFCFTSRPAIFSFPVNFACVKRLNAGGDVPVFKLFDSYTRAYGITVQNCQWLKYALNTPLSLKLFCELYEGQSVTISRLSEVSMNQLWRRKIDKIQNEFNLKENNSARNQCVFKAIIALSRCFIKQDQIERADLLTVLIDQVRVNDEIAERILDHLESYGIVSSICKKGTGLLPNSFFYSPGIQGYFDYASAIYLLEEYKHPSLIDFNPFEAVDINTLYCLAVISIQKYKYLLTLNRTIEKVSNFFELDELAFYAMQHADLETAAHYRKQCIEVMSEGANSLVEIVNKLVLPLSRIQNHPLGVSMLDELLRSFAKPAQRDMVWSLPAFLRRAEGRQWEKNDSVAILYEDNEEYSLSKEDLFDGLPIIYAWMLSNVSNPVRKSCRDKLMKWAHEAPKEYYKLFLHFSDVNDPQIKCDLFSILMCVVYDSIDLSFVKAVSDWILSSILAPSQIDQNRDIAVRYYSIAIIEKAKMLGLYTDLETEAYLPPYTAEKNEIFLNKDALSGTRMTGYSAIDYDLARYVLVDHFDNDFNTWRYNQLEKLVEEVSREQPDYNGITCTQFIISAAYAYILEMGWNEEEFYNYSKDKSGNIIGGADCSISASYRSETHGAQSEVMTVCEKYVWQARNFISGFLCDRLLFGDSQIQLTDYNLLDDFIVPIQELNQIDPDNVPEDKPLYIPEHSSVVLGTVFDTKESLADCIKEAPDIDWEKWIRVDNSKSLYSIPDSKLSALSLYSCFYGSSGIKTVLFVNSIVIPTKDLSRFLRAAHRGNHFKRVCDPTDWYGGVESSCYITPKEMCWFPWKKHYDSYKAEEFPGIPIHSAVDRCCYNYPKYGDVYYSMPSAMLRSLLGIVDTDGYLYWDKSKNTLSEYSIAGQQWRNRQEYVLVGEDLILKTLSEKDLSLVWIMQELRQETGNAKERFGQFYAEKRNHYIGYFKDGKFVSERILTSFSSKTD